MNWKTEVPEDLQSVVSRFESPADLAKSYQELQVWKSRPLDDPEKRAETMRKLGGSDNVADYRLPEDASGPAKAILEQLQAKAREHLLPTSAFGDLASTVTGTLSAQQAQAEEQAKKAREANVALLKQLHGDKADDLLAAAADALRPYTDRFPDLKDQLEKSGLGSHAAIVEALAKVGRMNGISGPEGANPGGTTTKSAKDLQKRAVEIHSSKEFQDPRSHPILKKQLTEELHTITKELQELGYSSAYDPKI